MDPRTGQIMGMVKEQGPLGTLVGEHGMVDHSSAELEKPEKGLAHIYIVRHGETDLNAEDKLRGWKNVPLNEQGLREARDLAAKFKGVKLDKIFCSDLKRAFDTAAEIAKVTEDDLIPTRELRPINFGDWNGEKLSEVGPKMNELHEKWKQKPTQAAPGGESFTHFQDRMIDVFETVLAGTEAGERNAIVAHLRNCIWIMAYLKNGRRPLEGKDLNVLDFKMAGPTLDQKVGTVTVLEYNPQKDVCQVCSGGPGSARS